MHPLAYLSRFFNTVEINSTYHQAVRPEVARLWLGAVSHREDFLFTAKLGRRFTHDPVLDKAEVSQFSEGLKPLLKADRLGALLMQFPWSFRFSEENRERFVALRRAFHEFPLVAEFRHESWATAEAIGTLIDYRVGFCNIDQPEQPKAMPPTACLTSGIGYVRLHGRNPGYWMSEQRPKPVRADYMYSEQELAAWRQRILRIAPHSRQLFVVFNNDGRGQSLVNAFQMQAMLGQQSPAVPRDLLARYPVELQHFRSTKPMQTVLFPAAVGANRAA